MNISWNLSIKNLDREIRRLTIESFKGKQLNLKTIKSCHYSKCLIKNFSKEDKIICYVNCSHFYHKSCLENNQNKGDKNLTLHKNIPCFICEEIV
jgi:hypothetical protein